MSNTSLPSCSWFPVLPNGRLPGHQIVNEHVNDLQLRPRKRGNSMTQHLGERRHPLLHQPNRRQPKVKLHFRSRRNRSRMAQVQRPRIQLIYLLYTCGLTMTTDDPGTQIANGEITDAVIVGNRSMVVETVARTTFLRDIHHRVGIIVGTTGNEYDHRRRHVRLLLGPRPLLRQTTRKNTDCRRLGHLNLDSVH